MTATLSPTALSTVCARPDCALPVRSRGLCNRHYETHRTRMIAYGRWEPKFVPADGAREHYQALLDAGMHRNQIARLAGIKTCQLDNLIRPRKDRGDEPAKRVLHTTRDRLLALPVPAGHEVWRYASDGAHVDGTGSARRLQALVAIGWPQAHLGARLGVTPSNMTRPVYGGGQVTAGLARRVAALFDELQLTPGPSGRARLRAERNGWVAPLAWDEDTIDDPTAEPIVDADEDVDHDPVAVDRGVEWMRLRPAFNRASQEYRDWIGRRPPLTRPERLAVAERLSAEVSVSALSAALGIRASELRTAGVAA